MNDNCFFVELVTKQALAKAYALEVEAEVLKEQTLISGAMPNEFKIVHFFYRGESAICGTPLLLSTRLA